MGAAAVVMAVGAGMQIMGGIQANQAEADAERRNAEAYRSQAAYAMQQREREKLAFDMESRQFFGSQVSAFAKAGVDMSGSALMKLSSTLQRQTNESENIRDLGRREYQRGMELASEAQGRARRLNSWEYNLLQAGPGIMSAAGGMMNASKPSGGSGSGGGNTKVGTGGGYGSAGGQRSTFYSPMTGQWEPMNRSLA